MSSIPYLRHPAAWLVLMASMLLITDATAQDTASCSAQLSEAETTYFNGNFAQTIALLTPCIEAGAFEGDDATQAYILAGRSHVAEGNADQARTLIAALYTRQPDYEPGPRVPPPFRRLMAEVRDEMEADGRLEQARLALAGPALPEESASRSGSRRRAFLIGGGAAVAVAGVATAIALSTSGETDPPPTDDDFPIPIGRPPGQ